MSSAHILQQYPHQSQPTPPMSPSAFINLAMLEGQGDSASDGQTASSTPSTAESSLDFFKYYLDQQKQDSHSPQSQQPSTLSLADIEQFQTFFNNVNSTGGSGVTKPSSPLASTSSLSPTISSSLSPAFSAHQQHQPLFPFAEATALPPSAFSSSQIAQGSDLPIDPSLFSSILGPNNAAQAAQPAPAPTASTSKQTKRATSVSRKRAVSEMSMNDISEEEEDDEDDLEEMEVDVKPATKAARKASTTKKATAASKKAAAAQQQQQHPHALVPVPEWEDRPSKEVYDKLSSKEKRQMRNKISARNFRHRRKAHIDTLEAEISQKDGIITHLREEVGTLRSENLDLRADIEMLKKNWESIAAKISESASASTSQAAHSHNTAHALSPDEEDLYGAGSNSLPALSPGASSNASTSNETESNFFDASTSSSSASSARRVSTRSQAKPNVRKDIAPSTGSTIWDSPFGGGFRGVDVHTTLVPDISIGSPVLPHQRGLDAISGKISSTKDIAESHYSGYGQNMNPGLNNLSAEQLKLLRQTLVNGAGAAQQPKKDTVKDAFFDNNPFLLLRQESFQDYRGQLYSKLANNIAGIHSAQQANGDTASRQAPLAGFQPAFLVQPTTTSAPSTAITPQEVIHASTLVQKTLFEKMSSAFWDAFTGSEPQDSKGLLARTPASSKEMNAKKMADVIGGRSRLQVIPVEEKSTSDELEGMMQKLEIVKRS